MLLEMALFYFLWLSSIPLYICTTSSFFRLFYFNWRLITMLWFSSHIDTHQPQVHMGPPILNPLPPPSPPHPSGLSQSTSSDALLQALNLPWSSILHMVMYMFQCSSLVSSHPLLLPHSPKVCSLHLRLFCCLAYRVIITVFLNSACMS